jgi:Leucine-rich repeat (LRR) protein
VNLKELEISGNFFSTLPKSIVNLSKLKDFSLPDYVFTLSDEQISWLTKLDDNSNSIGRKLPLPPSSYMSITDRIYAQFEDNPIPKITSEDLEILIKWADAHNLDELEWREPYFDEGDGSWDGFPRDKKLLVRFKELNLLGAKCEVLPEEIGYLTQIERLNLGENNLTVLPEEIVNLVNLTFINLGRNEELKLSNKQEKWLTTLKENSATVWAND